MHPPVPDRNEHGAFGRVQHVPRRIDERQRAEVVHMQRHIQAPELLRNRKPLAFGHVRGANVAHPIAQFVRAQLVTEHVEVRQVMVGCARGERARDQARAGHDPAVRGREDGDPHRALVVAVHEEAVVVVERELRVRVRVWRPLQFVVVHFVQEAAAAAQQLGVVGHEVVGVHEALRELDAVRGRRRAEPVQRAVHGRVQREHNCDQRQNRVFAAHVRNSCRKDSELK
mmetsp:Transcript_11223/g.16392  ORF Transcript_11223/g.16392 Transcript_11223/m.16392 type:complete len:228 (+) Transcript_11223:581-1264(+)